MAVMSEGDGKTDIETSSNSDSGLSAYKLQQRLAKHKLSIPSKENVEDIPTSITPVSDTRSSIDKNRGVTDPKKESILKEKSEREFNLEKEKFERQLRIHAEQKEKDKVKNKREYNLEREKFERQICIDAEEKDRYKREFELEKERMEHQFQLEKERFDREAMMKEREIRLGIARELILSGKSSDEIAAIMKAL
ncbi:hypothetical protein O181_050608 [Austropuccinia psidii MF-1]|uniref:Uncharacterized protein n=1 Tax=Austropuccinia psidii MF-1 TaxID=1389203 RepID=A0A9Q3HMI7_9BASI|nr:hypothetical protein [Austropuccinia psidii MF-1]